ncbi:polysaccharide deacetylase family protein [Sinorhizobium saheli]|jgi:hypothetical protein|uniref:Polysaccharide deacetylase n=1 Tax=Sinorhizobium saheli TaxID=36856 RepID=A0A178Y4V1_SINSA|nr:polysaccharide deacetylase family protein [Sinorhizobium saheli]MQW85579.1 polysaccharide deacetylase family protein [Sinorhizobium saheli]OAP42043.1 polysaccharide deacetylase [Sinorhizobium saheli]
MTAASIWQPLVDALDRRRTAGEVVDFWLRDDDAIEPTGALNRLLELTERFSVPATLAVIPAHTDERLSDRLRARGDIEVAVHGWSHQSHAPAGEKNQELGAHRPREAVVEELRSGFVRLAGLYPAHFVPLLVPPWNRIEPNFIGELPTIGFRALSVFGPEASGKNAALFRRAEIKVINTHVDVMDWRGTRGCRDHAAIVADTVRRIDQLGEGGTVGILTHHLVHDESVWAFLSTLFEFTAAHPACRWRKVVDLIDR